MVYFKVNKKKSWEHKMCAKLRDTKQKKKILNWLHRNLRKCILKNSQFFANISKIKPKQKNALSKQCSPMGPLSPLKIFTLKMGTPCVEEYLYGHPFSSLIVIIN